MRALQRPKGGWGEFALVIGGAFGPASIVSVFYALSPAAFPGYTTGSLWYLTVSEIVMLLLLGGLLFHRSWTARSLGLNATWRDILVGLGLAAVAWLLYFAALQALGMLAPSAAEAAQNVKVVRGALEPSAVIAVAIVNPFYEEVFVTGYILGALKNEPSSNLAINVSVGVRLLYHLYQGAAGVLLIVPLGLLFAGWYAKNRRLWPLVLAHGIFDAIAFLPYTHW